MSAKHCERRVNQKKFKDTTKEKFGGQNVFQAVQWQISLPLNCWINGVRGDSTNRSLLAVSRDPDQRAKKWANHRKFCWENGVGGASNPDLATGQRKVWVTQIIACEVEKQKGCILTICSSMNISKGKFVFKSSTGRQTYMYKKFCSTCNHYPKQQQVTTGQSKFRNGKIKRSDWLIFISARIPPFHPANTPEKIGLTPPRKGKTILSLRRN